MFPTHHGGLWLYCTAEFEDWCSMPPEAASPDKQVDARDQKCPMPLLMAKRGLRELESGQVLEVLATDPGSERDFRSLERLNGHRVETQKLDDCLFRHLITKA